VGDDRSEQERSPGFPVEIDPSPSTVLRLEDDERVFAEGADHRVVQWRNVLFTHWFGPVSEVGLTASGAASADLSRRHEQLLVLNVIDYGLSIPSPSVQKKASSVLAETAGHVAATATVVPGEGFWASAARAAVATITLLSKARSPHKVFATTDDAAQWALPHVRPQHTPLLHLQRALERLTLRQRA